MSMTREELRQWFAEWLDDYYDDLYSEDDLTPEVAESVLAALRPVSREQVEKVWRGEWFNYRETSVGIPKRLCSRCGCGFIGFDTKFCENCGAPMTDEAVEMVMERLEALKDGSTKY